REGGGRLGAESGTSALANPAYPRWRDWRKCVGGNGENYIDANTELSGGQRRRVEIARALLCPGDAVILDEPFTGLDAAARDATAVAVLDLLDGHMLLLATHDAADAQALDISDIITL
ncbi:MAG: ATP-binding cassette domain-containing protein, partial [Collinsella sp.]|nr:ATP-binding cassette domain-containing protein [Collinsella sp.]